MISIERAKTIIESYGGQPVFWPEHERFAMQQLLKNSSELRFLQQQEIALDRFIGIDGYNDHPVVNKQACSHCAKQILKNLPEQEQTIPKLSPFSNRTTTIYQQFTEHFQPLLLLASLVILVVGVTKEYPIDRAEEGVMLSLTESLNLYMEAELAENEQVDDTLDVLAFLEPQIFEDD